MKSHSRGLARKMFVLTAALAAALFAAGCSGGGGEAGEVARVTAAPSTTESTPVVETSTVTLPEQVSEEVGVAPAGVFVSVADGGTGEDEGEDGNGGGGVLVYAGPDLDGLSEDETGSEAVPAEVVLRPVEFRTTGAGGITFYVRLGASHPLTECLSYVDGNPALSRLQAATAEAAKVEIAAIGQNCLGNPDAISDTADPDAAAVGCVDDTSDRIVDCPTVGNPQTETAATQTPTAQTEFPVTLQGCPPGQDCAALIPAPPAKRQPQPNLKLSPQEMRNRPGVLYGLYPNPYINDETASSEENQNKIRTVQYRTLNDIMFYDAKTNEEYERLGLWPEEGVQITINGCSAFCDFPRAEHTDIGWQILTDFVSDYETAMAYNGYTIYNTCQNPTGTRFPQLNPNSSMLDFMRQDQGWQTQANGTPPQGLPLEWYFQQAAQAAHDWRYLVWHNSWHREPQILLCEPLVIAAESTLQPAAHNIWMPSSYDPLRGEMTAPQNWDYHIMAISEDRSVVIIAACYTGADRELIYPEHKDFAKALIWEDGHYENGSSIIPDLSSGFQTCEEAATGAGFSRGWDGFIGDWLPEQNLAFTSGASYQDFVYGDYQYPGASLTSHFGMR